jgi:hypothetical protein
MDADFRRNYLRFLIGVHQRPTLCLPFFQAPLAALHRLRNARRLTQENLAQVLQGDISKMERRNDTYVSTLASYIKAMGGNLEIRAVFPDGGVVKVNRRGTR